MRKSFISSNNEMLTNCTIMTQINWKCEWQNFRSEFVFISFECFTHGNGLRWPNKLVSILLITFLGIRGLRINFVYLFVCPQNKKHAWHFILYSIWIRIISTNCHVWYEWIESYFPSTFSEYYIHLSELMC